MPPKSSGGEIIEMYGIRDCAHETALLRTSGTPFGPMSETVV